MAKRGNDVLDVLYVGQAIGNLILSGHITFTAYSWAFGAVDIRIRSDCFKEKEFILSVKEDDWEDGPSEAIRCGLLNRWMQGELKFEEVLCDEMTVKKCITDLRDKTLSHYRNSISRSRYEKDFQEILQLCDGNELLSYTAALACYIQLSFFGCAGYVVVGDSLSKPAGTGDTLKYAWYTPMYFAPVWADRRKWHYIGRYIILHSSQGEAELAKQTKDE